MLKDRFIEAARDPSCVYAIDGVDGGRLLSPLRADKPAWPQPGSPWNYAANGACVWYGFKAAAPNGRNLRFSIEFAAHSYSAEKTLIFSSASYGVASPFGLRLNSAMGLILGGLLKASAVTATHNNAAFDIALMGGSGSFYLYWRNFVMNKRYVIAFELIGNEYTLYINGERAAAYALEGIDVPYYVVQSYQSNADCEIFDIEYEDLTGKSVLYQYGTWETRRGLFTPFNLKTIDGRFTVDNATYVGYAATPLDLRGRSEDFTLIWRGIIGNGGPLALQGDSYASAMYLTYNKNGKYLEFAMGNGVDTVAANFVTENVTSEQVIACVANFAAQEARLYVNGELKSGKTIPAGFGGLAADMTREQLAVYPAGGLRGFGMFDRAMNAGEVTAHYDI